MKATLIRRSCELRIGTSADAQPFFARKMLAVFVLITGVGTLVGHGCHGDDIDHEPGVILPVRDECFQRADVADSNLSDS